MTANWFQNAEDLLSRRVRLIGVGIALCGLLWRIYYARDFYLDPDEAMHYLVAVHPWHGLVGFYRNATRVVHPPLFIAMLQGILLFGRAEWLLRLVPSLAGAAFPWFVALWMQRMTGNAAALVAQLFLTFSPTLIEQSTEVRAYGPAFLFLALALVLLQQALDSGSGRFMIAFHLFLYLAILTEYCVAWFVAALGIYALAWLWKNPASANQRMIWALGQVGALSLYLFLYFTHIARFSHVGLLGMYSTWLQGAFPRSNENLFAFALRGTYRQFLYEFQLRPAAWLGLGAFILGLCRLWRSRSLAVILLVVPFVFACLGALLHLFPYGATRHTSVLAISVAVGLGCGLALLARERVLPVLAIALPIVVAWNALSTDAFLPIARYRHHRPALQSAIGFLLRDVPSGSVIVTDTDTDLILSYYLGCPDYGYYDVDEAYRMRDCSGLRMVVAPTFQFSGPAELRDTLALVRGKYRLERPVWVVAGGFSVDVSTPVSNARPFGQTVAIFEDSE